MAPGLPWRATQVHTRRSAGGRGLPALCSLPHVCNMEPRLHRRRGERGLLHAHQSVLELPAGSSRAAAPVSLPTPPHPSTPSTPTLPPHTHPPQNHTCWLHSLSLPLLSLHSRARLILFTRPHRTACADHARHARAGRRHDHSGVR